MAKGKFWRPPKYTLGTFSKKVEAYVQERKFGKEKGPITVLDFCCFAGVYKDYISEHDLAGTDLKGSENDFSEPIKVLKTEAENCLEYYALRWKLNPTMAIFSLKNNYKWVDKQEVETNNNTKVAAEFRIVRPSSKAPQTAPKKETEEGN